MSNVMNLTAGRDGGGPSVENVFYSVKEMVEASESDPEIHSKSKYFQVNGFVSWVVDNNDRPMYYLACVTCKKKVIDEPNGFRCEGCQKSYKDAVPTYNFSFKLSDYSDGVFVSCLSESGEVIMGMPSKDYYALV